MAPPLAVTVWGLSTFTSNFAMHHTPLVVSEEDRVNLERNVRRPTSTQRSSLRSRIVLLAAEGLSLGSIARPLHCRKVTVRKWVRRYSSGGLRGLADAKRPGRSRTITALAAVLRNRN